MELGNTKYLFKSNQSSIKFIIAFGLFVTILFEWIIGTACTTPQVIHDIQTAEPLQKGEQKVSPYFGISWAPTSVVSLGVPNIPNADFSLIYRKLYIENKEFQIPGNISIRLGPDIENVDSWFEIQFSSGLLFKIAQKQNYKYTYDPRHYIPNDENRKKRSLYKAHIAGPRVGVYHSTTYDMEGTHFYLGGYYKLISEYEIYRGIKFRGLILFFNVYPTMLKNESDAYFFMPSIPFESFTGGFFGKERSKVTTQFTFGFDYQHLLGPKLYIGFTVSPNSLK